MFQRLARFFVLIAAVQVLGGHWAVLQTVAWTKMLIDYTERESLTVAVTKTFDGAHPCSLCATVSEGRQQEKKQEATTIIVKLDAVLPLVAALPARSMDDWAYPEIFRRLPTRTRAPLTPPPLV